MGFGEDIKVPKAELGQEYSSGFKRGQEFGFGELEAGQRIGEQQQRLARALQERAEGRAPSIAQMQLAQALEQQGAATQEIARNVQEASRGTSEVSSNIAAVSEAAGSTGAAATEVRSSAADVAQQGEALRGEVDRFLAGIRAA